MYYVRVPETEQKLQQCFQCCWKLLRKPLHQPPGSEREAYDTIAYHKMVIDEQEEPVAAVVSLYVKTNEVSIHFLVLHQLLMIKQS